MKYTVFIAASAAALALAGCKKEPAPSGDMVTSAASDSVVAPMAKASASLSQQFADAAATSDAFEIESSKLAATRAKSDKVKHFAEQMIKAHTESTIKLKTASPTVPMPQLTSMQQQTLDTLGALTGAEFDAAYVKAQVDAHQMTLDTLKAYSVNGDAPPLKAFATALIPTVTAHLNMAKGLK